MLDTIKDCILTALTTAVGAAAAIIGLGVVAALWAAIVIALAGGPITMAAVVTALIAVFAAAGAAAVLGSVLLIAGCIVLFWVRSAADGDAGIAGGTADQPITNESPCLVCTAFRAGLFAGAMGVLGFIAARQGFFSF